MNGILITWPQLLYAGLALLVFYVAELLLFLRKANSPHHLSRQAQQRIETMSGDMAALRQELELLKVRLAANSMQQAWAVEHHGDAGVVDTTAVAQPLTETPYAQAIRLARTGADSAAVAQQCGISRGEADLIVALYRAEGLR
ncbi:DUF2802 domain-containing protein [Silvimonas amylolytica]|uniref:DUF2802 domain-containing protein n=1 Tax=Silvimonas amylolytica TaxID=449663 RepID=A0ABQ2PGW9_9NEIS|nr:DUF2802 domain-containing protein [Silvimonas amylolytica]GGP24593.1 hypothetical protein GCM10010971_04120 [Silvimonas amylolytica]